MLDTVRTEQGVYHEVALFEKLGHFSVVALSAAGPIERVIGRNDTREAFGIMRSVQADEATARANFENGIRHSIDNGWRLVWRGFPYGKPE